MLAGLAPPEASVLGSDGCHLALSSHSLSCAWAQPWGLSVSKKDTSHAGLGPTLMASFEFNHHFKDFVS